MVRVLPNKNLLNTVYPVAGSGAAKQLEHIDQDKREEVTARISHEFKLTPFGSNATEGTLCETAVLRLGVIKDYFIKGMDLFRLSETGHAIVKLFGSNEWHKVE